MSARLRGQVVAGSAGSGVSHGFSFAACRMCIGCPVLLVLAQGMASSLLPVNRALADCGLAGLPEQSSGPSPLVHVPDEGPAGRASNIGGRFLRILRGGLGPITWPSATCLCRAEMNYQSDL